MTTALRPALDPFELMRDRLKPQPNPWHMNPVGFIETVLDDVMWSKQIEICEALRDHNKILVRSCHGSGKSWLMARIVSWWVSSAPDRVALTTAPTGAQVKAILWQEIADAHAQGGLGGQLNLTEWRIGGKLVAFGRKPQDHNRQAMQGIHSHGGVLVVLDEADGIPVSLWTAADSIATTEADRIIAIGNPDTPTSTFAKRHKSRLWHKIRIRASDTPNFTDEGKKLVKRHGEKARRMLRALVSPKWAADLAEEYGDDSNEVTSKVHAEFPTSSKDQLIDAAWIARAREKWKDMLDDFPREMACDVARYGANKTAIYLRCGMKVHRLRVERNQSTVETAAWITNFFFQTDAERVKVDGNGVGGGVVDSLEADRRPVADMNAGASASDKRRFVNARAEWFWTLRDLLKNDEIGLPEDDELLADQLQELRYRVNKKGQIEIESKEDMEKRGVESPDRADTVAMLFAEPAVPDVPDEDAAYFRQASMYAN